MEEAAKPDVIQHRGRLDDLGRGFVMGRIQDFGETVGEVVGQPANGHLETIDPEWCDPELRSVFAASTAGAKERVARLGAHLLMRDDAAPGPLTQASAPQAPGRPGREDARNFGGATL